MVFFKNTLTLSLTPSKLGLFHLSNVRYLGNGPLDMREALVDRPTHAGNSLRNRAQLGLTFHSISSSRVSESYRSPRCLDATSCHEARCVRSAVGLTAPMQTTRRPQATTAGAQRRPLMDMPCRHGVYPNMPLNSIPGIRMFFDLGTRQARPHWLHTRVIRAAEKPFSCWPVRGRWSPSFVDSRTSSPP